MFKKLKLAFLANLRCEEGTGAAPLSGVSVFRKFINFVLREAFLNEPFNYVTTVTKIHTFLRLVLRINIICIFVWAPFWVLLPVLYHTAGWAEVLGRNANKVTLQGHGNTWEVEYWKFYLSEIVIKDIYWYSFVVYILSLISIAICRQIESLKKNK